MRIIYIIDSFGYGGRERQLQYILKNLKDDFEINFWILSNVIGYEIPLPADRIHVVDHKRRYKLSTIKLFLKTTKKFKPDVIYFWDIISGIYSAIYKLMTSSPIINGSIRFGGSLKKSMMNKVIRGVLYWYSDAIVANSRAGLRAEGLDNHPKSTIVYNGIDFVQFDSGHSSIRNELGIPSDAIVVVMVAGFRPAKDYNTLIKAALKVRSKYDNVWFLLVGDGLTKPDIEQTVRQNDLNNVLLLGRRNDIEDIILGSDIGILLSNIDGHAEGLSNSIMEYMAAGLPVIATNAGGNPEIVVDSETGFLVRSNDPTDVTDKIILLAKNENMRIEFGINSQKRIREEFSIDSMINSHINVLKGVMLIKSGKHYAK